MIASQLKQPARLTVQVRGHGPVSTLVVDCDQQLRIRGMASAPADLVEAPISALVGDGHLVMTLQTDEAATPYQSLVPLQGETVERRVRALSRTVRTAAGSAVAERRRRLRKWPFPAEDARRRPARRRRLESGLPPRGDRDAGRIEVAAAGGLAGPPVCRRNCSRRHTHLRTFAAAPSLSARRKQAASTGAVTGPRRSRIHPVASRAKCTFTTTCATTTTASLHSTSSFCSEIHTRPCIDAAVT
jgi:hypothetical protein